MPTISQIAVAVVLAIAAGLLVRSFVEVHRTDLGFAPDGLWTFDVALPSQYTSEATVGFFDELQERLESLPQVSSAGAISHLPLGGGDFSWTYLIRDRPLADGVPLPRADVRMLSPGALEALRIPIRRGRSFLRTDHRNAHPVAIISETFARRSWPGENPIGKEVKLEGPLEALPWMTVVGVAAEVHSGSPDREPPPAIYRPHSQHRGGSRRSSYVLPTAHATCFHLSAIRSAA